MSAAVAVPIITAGIQSLFSLFGNHQASKASSEAARINQRSMSEALTYEREQAEKARQYQATRDARSDMEGDVNRAERRPYVQAGQGAVTTLGELVNPMSRVNGGTGMVTNVQTGQGQSLGDLVAQRSAVTPLPTAAKQKWKAPTGEVKEFDPGMESKLEAQGAVRVG